MRAASGLRFALMRTLPPQARPSDTSRHLLAVLLLILPWVQPWAPGPEPNTVPLLISWGSAALLLAMGHWPSAHQFAQAWACAALISSAMGLVQYFGEAARLGGWVHVPGYLGEALGNLRQRNQLATLSSLGAVAVLWWRSQGLSRIHTTWMLALLAAGNAATGSRTGLLQWGLLPVLMLVWQGGLRGRQAPWSWPWLLWAWATYLLATLVLPVALSQGAGAEVSSAVARMAAEENCGSRRVLWANVWQLVTERPWGGWGWGELKYAHYSAQYPGTRFCDILGHAHNLPLHLAFSFGMPAALGAMLALLVWLLRARPWRLKRPTDSLAWGVLAMVALHSLLEYPLWYGPFQIATLASVLLLRPAGHGTGRPLGLAWRGLGAAVLAMSLLIAADYERTRQIYLSPAHRGSLWQDDPWGAARRTVFFGAAVQFAEVTTTPVRPDNAAAMLAMSQAALHYSPEPRVIEQVIASARLVGQAELAQWHEAQKAAVYGAAPR
jgi:O-antigen ligase